MRRLRALLVPLGIVIAAATGSFMVLRVGDGVTNAQLRDAGILLCPDVDLACEVRVAAQFLDRLEARPSDAGRAYRRVVLDGRDCRDAGLGLIVTDRRLYLDGGWRGGVNVIDGRCRVMADAGVMDDGGTGLKELQLECGCRKASGVCRYRLPDAGQATAPFGVTLGPGYSAHTPDASFPTDSFGGAGCARKSCAEFFGDTSWPEECPGG